MKITLFVQNLLFLMCFVSVFLSRSLRSIRVGSVTSPLVPPTACVDTTDLNTRVCAKSTPVREYFGFWVIYRRLLYKAVSRLIHIHTICRHCPPLSQPFTKRVLLDQHIQMMHDVKEPEFKSQEPADVDSQPNKVHLHLLQSAA